MIEAGEAVVSGEAGEFIVNILVETKSKGMMTRCLIYLSETAEIWSRLKL